ncbi:MAG: ABC transporter permease [Flavobacteriaceae bacterium]
MTAITYYISSVKNELFKLKRTFAFWLTLLASFFVPGLLFVVTLFKHKNFIPKDDSNPWDLIMQIETSIIITVLIPFFILLVTSLIMQLEHRSGALKDLFSLPVPKWSIYYGKLTIVLATVFITYLLFSIFLLTGGYISGLLFPDLNYTSFSPDFLKLFKTLGVSFVASLGVVGLQFWLSFRIKNFIIPLGIGMVLVIAGLIIGNYPSDAVYYPYSYNMVTGAYLKGEVNNMFLWYSLGFFAITTTIGYIDISRKNIV